MAILQKWCVSDTERDGDLVYKLGLMFGRGEITQSRDATIDPVYIVQTRSIKYCTGAQIYNNIYRTDVRALRK
jgi:hypothetical protein